MSKYTDAQAALKKAQDEIKADRQKGNLPTDEQIKAVADAQAALKAAAE